jgi:hypothetical protein
MTDTEVLREHMARALRRQPDAVLLEHHAESVRLGRTAALSADVKAAIETVLAERRVSLPTSTSQES